MAGRVFDGEKWTDLKDPPPSTGSGTPLPPVVDGDGSIFVGIPSFRGKSHVVIGGAFLPSLGCCPLRLSEILLLFGIAVGPASAAARTSV